MKKVLALFAIVISLTILTACSQSRDVDEAIQQEIDRHFSVGVLLSETGIGDQSFNDLAIKGLVRAREEQDITWTYEDLTTSKSMEEGLQKLVEQKPDVIIGVGYSVQPLIDAQAEEHPDMRFVLIDTSNDVDNVDSILFKENEGSFLAGVVAAKLTKTNTLGFLGGFEDPVILKFLDGYKAGAESVNPNIKVATRFANTYSDDKVGANLASDMIEDGADVLYAAAGYTGVGLLQQAQKQKVYAIGVDNDQYFYAEKAIVTSMTKNIDVAVFNYIKALKEDLKQPKIMLEAGIKEDGVALAPIRIVSNAVELEEAVEKAKTTFTK